MHLGWTHRSAKELAEFDRLYLENEKKVFSLAMRLTGDEFAAEDIGQKTFLTLHVKLKEVLKHPNPTAWLLEAARYYIKHYWREQSIRAQHEVPLELADEIEATYNGGELSEFLAGLPDWIHDTDEEMLTLRYYYGYSLREVAAIVGFTYSATRNRMARLIQKLREHGYGKVD